MTGFISRLQKEVSSTSYERKVRMTKKTQSLDQGPSEKSGKAEALRVQNEWLRVTLASIGDAVITTDSNGCITFLNPVAQSLTGWKQEEAAVLVRCPGGSYRPRWAGSGGGVPTTDRADGHWFAGDGRP